MGMRGDAYLKGFRADSLATTVKRFGGVGGASYFDYIITEFPVSEPSDCGFSAPQKTGKEGSSSNRLPPSPPEPGYSQEQRTAVSLAKPVL